MPHSLCTVHHLCEDVPSLHLRTLRLRVKRHLTCNHSFKRALVGSRITLRRVKSAQRCGKRAFAGKVVKGLPEGVYCPERAWGV